MSWSCCSSTWPKNGPWKQSHKLFQTYISLWMVSLHTPFLSPTWKHPPDEKKKKPQHSDSTPVRRQNKLWKKITQDSSSWVRNLKHPAMCTASSRVPGGARGMPISLLFCHAVPPVSRQSCHRYSLYIETDTSRCGTRVNTTHTCMIDAKSLFCLVASTSYMNVAELCTVHTPTLSWEDVWFKRMFHKGIINCGADDNDDQLQSLPWQSDHHISACGCWFPRRV